MAENGAQLKELSSAQRKGIAALLSARNVEAAAKASGIGERTLWRWLAEEHFKAALANEEMNLIDFAVRQLLQLQQGAIGILAKVLADPKTPASVKVRAALGMLDITVKLRELRNVEARLCALEALYFDGERKS
jgi:hypothetical protein